MAGAERAEQDVPVDLLAAAGDQATAFIILASIVVPLIALGWLCWFFWTHRHDE